MPRKVKQSQIRAAATRLLWGRAAARCEFPGCNKQLWRSSVTGETVNLAERAHIYAASDLGPRGSSDVPLSKLNSIENLLLVCMECHTKIDQRKDGGRYTADFLLKAKAHHESRIELVTGIHPSKRSHILHYGSPVGDVAKLLKFTETAAALFPERYPAEDRAISLEMVNSVWRDRDARFWTVEEDNLRGLFKSKILPRLTMGQLEHLSVFGFAPQPLLVLLGALLTDIVAADVYQLQREPANWGWAHPSLPCEFVVNEPIEPQAAPVAPVALALSISATITADRIISVLGDQAQIWEVTVGVPSKDIINTPSHLRDFRETMRVVLDRIKKKHGQWTAVNVFPAMPVSIAIEFGRIRMPKADAPWEIWDQMNDRGGFIPAISIGPRRP